MRIAAGFLVGSALLLALSPAGPARAGSASIACQLLKARVTAATTPNLAARRREFRASCETRVVLPRRRTAPQVQHRHYRRFSPQPTLMGVDNPPPPSAYNPAVPSAYNPNTKPCCSQPIRPRDYSSLEDAIRNGDSNSILLKTDIRLEGPLHISKSVTIRSDADANGRPLVITGQIIVDSGFVSFSHVVLQGSGNSPTLTVNGGNVSLVGALVQDYTQGPTVIESDRTPSLLVLGGEVSITRGSVGEHAAVGIQLAGGSLAVRDASLAGANFAILAVGGVLRLERSSLSAATGTMIAASGRAAVYASNNTFTASTALYPVMFSASVQGSLEDNIFKFKTSPVWLCISRGSSLQTRVAIAGNVDSQGRSVRVYSTAEKCF